MSFGVEHESSFEAEVLERTRGTAFLYDFSVSEYGPQLQEASKDIQSRAHFRAYGLGSTDEIIDGNRFHTLRSLMSAIKIDHVDILKIDIEGAETQ